MSSASNLGSNSLRSICVTHKPQKHGQSRVRMMSGHKIIIKEAYPSHHQLFVKHLQKQFRESATQIQNYYHSPSNPQVKRRHTPAFALRTLNTRPASKQANTTHPHTKHRRVWFPIERSKSKCYRFGCDEQRQTALQIGQIIRFAVNQVTANDHVIPTVAVARRSTLLFAVCCCAVL
jgi:hypothetical protein